ncbi:lipoprotein, putative [Arcticibacter svalbardensis MN12-7]|uniref:Lipoprotein, putative n=1 Tax=Arcticibacter svalbardensis MN12-7 TaxID=1150600 RepID=R9GTH3_9SPHI|nr:TlpA disulfide reductase family protein [Arcticibacter svalbardensis]EOR94850.1 lipoprotein, putative [Arcticibacter svalbardensis MN12-7]
MPLKTFRLFYTFIITSTVLFTACGKSENGLSQGTWRATIKNEAGTEVPFNFEVLDSAGKKVIYILNANDRLKVDDITVTADSAIIKLPLFDSEFRAAFTSDGLTGNWVRHLADKSVSMEFNAERDVKYRFFEEDPETPEQITGRWSSNFISTDGKDTTLAVGEFTQHKSKVTGTFLTTTGDYRFLEGSISQGKLFLSAFDGSNCMLFTGTIDGKNIVDGKLYSGFSSVTNWSAAKDDQAILPDAYSLTTLKPGFSTLAFSFPNLDGKIVSLTDPVYKNKVVIIQFLGTWCPNCMDETAFMTDFYKQYKDRGVEVIGLAFERTSDPIKSKNSIERLQKRFDITYPLLITGYSNKDVLKGIPALQNFNAFPTTIIIDKKGKVNKIHTGFSGPGTGKYYTDFIKEFETHVNHLLTVK